MDKIYRIQQIVINAYKIKDADVNLTNLVARIQYSISIYFLREFAVQCLVHSNRTSLDDGVRTVH